MCTYSSNVDKKNYHNSSIISYLILKYKEHRDEKKKYIYIYNRRFDAIFSPTAVSRSPIFEGFSAIRWFSRTLDVIYIYACIWTRGCNASCDAAATNEGWGPWRVCAPSPYRVYNAPPPFLSPSLHPLARPPTILQLSPSPLFSPPIFTPGAPRYIPATLPGVT